ncbi:auxilin-like clathrin uncoating factor Swa2p [Monosporozyma unispora]
MSDPFANLLDTFKQGGAKKTVSPAASATPQSISTPLIPSKSGTPAQSVSKPPQQVKDDLDHLFNVSVNHNNNTATTQKSNEEWDKAFDIFDTTNVKDTVNIPKKVTPPEETVVDEVEDMEIAQIMSLGYTFDQSLKFINKGLTYETLLKRQYSHKPSHNKSNNNDKFNLDRNTMPTSGPSVGETIMDSAWNMFSKSKQLVDSWTQFDPNENNRLSHTNEYQQPLEDYDYDEDDLQEEFENNLNLEQTPSPNINNSNNNLLDFDIPEEPSTTNIPEETSTTNTATQNTLLDFDQPSTTSVSTPHKTQQTVGSNISDIELLSYNEFKDNATQLFKNGHYAEALEQYTKSLNTLPLTHPLRLIAISNMMISQLKIGEYNNIIKLNGNCQELFPPNEDDWKDVISNSDPKRTFKDIWSKIMLRYAEALEHLENYKIALITYQEMLDKNITNPKVLEGKRRCEKVLNPDKFKPLPSQTNTTTHISTSPQMQKTINNNKPKNTENSDRIKQINANLEKEADLKVKLYDQVELKINNWKSNKPDDIRFLLSTLSTILTWTNWNPVSTADLVMPKKVKMTYMKAVAKTHPDKIPSTLDLENKMIAENVFATLSEAWEKFKLENNIA